MDNSNLLNSLSVSNQFVIRFASRALYSWRYSYSDEERTPPPRFGVTPDSAPPNLSYHVSWHAVHDGHVPPIIVKGKGNNPIKAPSCFWTHQALAFTDSPTSFTVKNGLFQQVLHICVPCGRLRVYCTRPRDCSRGQARHSPSERGG